MRGGRWFVATLAGTVVPFVASAEPFAALLGPATSLATTLDLANRLMELGDYESAVSEYRRFLALAPDGRSSFRVHERIAEALALKGDTNDAANAWQRAQRFAVSREDRELTQLQQGMLHLASGEHSQASTTLLGLAVSTPDPVMGARASYLAALSALEQRQFGEARTLFSDAFATPEVGARAEVVTGLDSLLATAPELPRRSPAVARHLSTVIPGSGQMYAGAFWNGVNALALNGLTTWLLVRSARTGQWDEVVLNVALFWGRYYLGNRYQAAVRAEQFNRRQEEKLRAEAVHLAREAVRDPGQ